MIRLFDTGEPMLSVQLWIGRFAVELVNYQDPGVATPGKLPGKWHLKNNQNSYTEKLSHTLEIELWKRHNIYFVRYLWTTFRQVNTRHSLANRHSCSTSAETRDRKCFSIRLISVVGKVDMIN